MHIYVVHAIKTHTKFYIYILLRAPTIDVANVPNAKYLAHQTSFEPIYQMCHISYFLQHATIPSQICHGTERVWHMFYSFYIPLFLSSLCQSHLVP